MHLKNNYKNSRKSLVSWKDNNFMLVKKTFFGKWENFVHMVQLKWNDLLSLYMLTRVIIFSSINKIDSLRFNNIDLSTYHSFSK